MSERPNPYASGAYAAYKASTFSSAARVCAHETDFIAARIRVLNSLGVATAEETSAARRLAENARAQELQASKASDRSHDASRQGLPVDIVRSHTSATLGHMKRAHELESRAHGLERAIVSRSGSRQSPCNRTTSPITVWNVPARGRPRVNCEFASAGSDGLRQFVAAWARDAKARDELLIRVCGDGDGIVQIARPKLYTETWPWTVRVLRGRKTDEKLPQSLVEVLAKRRFVSHFDPGMWCHVAPRQPQKLAPWLVAVIEAVAVAP